MVKHMVMKSQCSVCSNAMTINEWLCSVEDMKDEETHADQFYYQTLCLSRKGSLIFIFLYIILLLTIHYEAKT